MSGKNDIDAFLANYYRSRRTIPKLHFDYVSRRKPNMFYSEQQIRDIYKEECKKQDKMFNIYSHIKFIKPSI